MKAKKLSSFLLLSLVLVPSLTVGQELLPKDNGLWDYHYAPDYRESESHPLRTVAWVLHPVGWVLREAIYRPLSSFTASTAFTRSFFGYRGPFEHRDAICFAGAEEVPDCKNIAPMNRIGYAPTMSAAGDTASLSSSGETQVFFPDVAFEFDHATLNALGRGRVRQIAQLLSSVPTLNVVVEGHTDVQGSEDYNLKLAEKRAQTVLQELSELGIDAARLSPIAKGESEPIFTESEDWAHAVNRRVQFKVQGTGA